MKGLQSQTQKEKGVLLMYVRFKFQKYRRRNSTFFKNIGYQIIKYICLPLILFIHSKSLKLHGRC